MGLNFHDSLRNKRGLDDREASAPTSLHWATLGLHGADWPRRSLGSRVLCKLDPDLDSHHWDDHICSAKY